MQTPLAFGKISNPTIDSNNEDFPEDYVPNIAIQGIETWSSRPKSLKSSINLMKDLNEFY